MSLIRKAMVTSVATAMSAGIQMLNGILVARGLGVAGLGQFRVTSEFCMFAGTIAGLGVGQASIFLINNRKRPIGDVTSALAWMAGCWCPIYGLLLAWILPRLTDYSEGLSPFVIACLSGSSAILIGSHFLRPILLAELRAFHNGSVDIVSSGCQLIMTIVLLALNRLTVQTALLTPLVASLAGLATVLWYVRGHLSWRVPAFGQLVRELLRYDVLMATRSVAWVALTTAPALLIPQLMTDGKYESVGLFRAATGICALIGLIGSAVSPLLYSNWSTVSDSAQRARQIEAVTRFYVLGGMGIALVLTLLAEPALRLMYGAAFIPAAGLLRILAFGTAIQLLGTILQNVFPAIGRPLLGAVMFLVTLTINLGLNWFWIPKWGAYGAAAAMVASAVAFAAMGIAMAVRLCEVRIAHCFVPKLEDLRRFARAVIR